LASAPSFAGAVAANPRRRVASKPSVTASASSSVNINGGNL
jgi:hypothetical protein